jgi:hypothetical protein
MERATSRPIPSRKQAVSFSAATQSGATAVLTYLLNNTHPEDLHDRISKAVHGRMMLPADVENLLSSLQTAGVVTSAACAAVEDNTLRHCVRCHSVYIERNNGLKACVVWHDPPRLMKTDRPVKDSPVYKHFYPCCNQMTDVGGSLGPFPHSVGRHTTLAASVRFNKTNILTCEERKCGGIAARAPPLPANVGKG